MSNKQTIASLSERIAELTVASAVEVDRLDKSKASAGLTELMFIGVEQKIDAIAGRVDLLEFKQSGNDAAIQYLVESQPMIYDRRADWSFWLAIAAFVLAAVALFD